MNDLGFVFFALAAIVVLVGGICTVAARNPIRGAMGLLTSIAGIAAMYLLLSAEFLAAIQILVYAGAVVVLFLFVIMLLGPAATTTHDGQATPSRYVGAGAFLAAAAGGLWVFVRSFAVVAGPAAATGFPPAPASLGTIEGLGRELFSVELLPFELSSALLLVAVVGAVAVARGRHVDPTLHPGVAPSAGQAEKAIATDSHVPADRPRAVHDLTKESAT